MPNINFGKSRKIEKLNELKKPVFKSAFSGKL